MRGADVVAVQKRLGLVADGVYGQKSATAVKAWRWRTGFPRALPGLGPWGQSVLSGKTPLPADYRARARERAAGAPPPVDAPVGLKAVRVMRHWAELGLVERPVTAAERRRGLTQSNDVPRLGDIATALKLAPWYAAMGWPWCAFATMLAARVYGGVTATAGFNGRFNVLYVPDIVEHADAGRFGMRIVPRNDARIGDLVTFNWDGGVDDHIGRLRGWDGGSILTVEGNTSSGASGSQNNGGGVYLRSRPSSVITHFIRDT